MKSTIPPEQMEQFEELKQTQKKLAEQWIDYWREYSSFDTWQFWFNAAMIVLPLIILYFTIDRKRIFLLGFYGFNIHVWGAYLDALVTRYNYIGYPYKAIPFLPFNVSIDTSFAPVLFILIYQWTLEKKKNFYLYTLFLICFLAFLFRPLSVAHNLFLLGKGANYVHLFFGYIVIVLISKGITNLFLYMKNHPIAFHK
ncbi:hypothetical protein WQ54_28205 [Bacillus sp. SA1-12]|uniref:CBO0543 family protein n=1 Tax=Bacillus sp. SA1-12 TaxID=1455638 RepID=UPI0006270718|nr:CBO0543 family protein [Bacillus sp. SA1-12]KKI89108.1 hypothetical protein WQ54_28205 [Bacillus sp. SA1-12]